MEKLLYIWMEDEIQKRTPAFYLQTKASLFQTLKKRAGETTVEFVASTGWLERFRKRFQFS